VGEKGGIPKLAQLYGQGDLDSCDVITSIVLTRRGWGKEETLTGQPAEACSHKALACFTVAFADASLSTCLPCRTRRRASGLPARCATSPPARCSCCPITRASSPPSRRSSQTSCKVSSRFFPSLSLPCLVLLSFGFEVCCRADWWPSMPALLVDLPALACSGHRGLPGSACNPPAHLGLNAPQHPALLPGQAGCICAARAGGVETWANYH
jgi:hypothetical protein